MAFPGPLTIHSSGRYLVDSLGRPFRPQIYTPWVIVTEPTLAELRQVLDSLKATGFNGILFQMTNPVKYVSGANSPGSLMASGALPFSLNLSGGTWNGDPTFAGDLGANNPAPGNFDADFSTANATYFAAVDTVLDELNARDMLGIAVPHYNGYNQGAQDGWWRTYANNSTAKCQSLGTFLGNRYKNYPNLMWSMGVDMTPSVEAGPTHASTLKARAMLDSIKAAGDAHLWGGHWKASRISTDDSAFADVMDVQFVYTHGNYPTDGPTYGRSRVAYSTSPARPCLLIETAYEEENSTTVTQNRAHMWWAAVSTPGAITFGNGTTWKAGSGWLTKLGTPATIDVHRLGLLFNAIPWYQLVPSALAGTLTLVTAGTGTYTTMASPGDFEVGGLDWVASAATSDGRWLVAYRPPTHSGTFTVDMAAMAGQARARWFDPTAGTYQDIGTFRGGFGAPSQVFTPPANNAAGQTDHVLVLNLVEMVGNKRAPVGSAGPRGSARML